MQEPASSIRWTMFFFAGGDAAIVGIVGIVVCAMLYQPSDTKPLIRPFYRIAMFVVSLLLTICGSLQLPTVLQAVGVIWAIVALGLRPHHLRNVDPLTAATPAIKHLLLRRMTHLFPLVWFMCWLMIEAPYHFWHATGLPGSTLLVIGDSVTAGLNDNDDTWPQQLARSTHLNVMDVSQPGATLHSALQQNRRLRGRGGLLILEIGGNDLLEGLPVARFDADLDQLLSEATQPNRTIVMFELPLPPLCAAYGRSQRVQATKHHAHLIPKRQFAKILTTTGATVDGIHLSNAGQTLMATLVQNLLREGLQTGAGTYHRIEATLGSEVQ